MTGKKWGQIQGKIVDFFFLILTHLYLFVRFDVQPGMLIICPVPTVKICKVKYNTKDILHLHGHIILFFLFLPLVFFFFFFFFFAKYSRMSFVIVKII